MKKESSKLINNIYSVLPTSTSLSKNSAIVDTGASAQYLQADDPYHIALRKIAPIRLKQPNCQILKYKKGVDWT